MEKELSVKSLTYQYRPDTMERHVTFIDPPEKAANNWLQRQKTSPAIPAGNNMSLPVMRRSVTRGQNGMCSTHDKEQLIQREATQLFERERSRLMEKPGATTTHRHSHEGTAWGEKGGTQHTQYIRRLADLRDELINQEETALARALDRLRLHSINNRDAARYRLKIKDPAVETPRVPGMPVTQGTNFPRPMVTTVEKFRQMRPQRRPPVIFPLQGKQLIESGAGSNNTNGPTRAPTAEEGPRVEDTVKANLQRLIQPTSSIPNIGRKALRQESLELKSQSLQNMRNRVFKTPRPHFASPFMLQSTPPDGEDGGGGGSAGWTGGMDSRADSEGEFHLSPHAYKLGPMMDGDRLNMDKLNQYYYICCLPPDTPVDTSREGGERRSVSVTPRQARAGPGQHHRGLRSVGGIRVTGQKPRRTHSERSPSQQAPSPVTGSSRPYSDRGSGSSVGGGGGMAVSSSADVDPETGSASSVIVNSRFRHSVENLNGGGVGDRVSLLPVIHADAEGPHGVQYQLRHNGVDSAFLTQQQHHHYHHHHHQERGAASTPNTSLSTERRKRHIVVDMPHIIFNAATPDISKEPSIVEHFPLPERPGALSKTLKQNEIRHRELQNLLEDVKELNKRTETLNTHAQNTELEFDTQQPAGVC